MAFPSATNNAALGSALTQLQNVAAGIKSTAMAAVTFLADNNVNTAYVFQTLDQLSGVITLLNSFKNVVGLNAYATANIPGYAGTLTTDLAVVVSAAQACIDWVVTNTAGVTWYSLNADGTRTMAMFTPTQTAGFRTTLTALAATIS
jgi:hypothetical protein